MKTILVWFVLTISYFISRLINLKIIPIFTDEAIYTYWAQVALHDPANRFISLEDGKQPLFIWLAAISQKFINDPLVASRIVSVIAGFGSVIGIYILAKTLFGQKAAALASFLYIILPFTLLYDRLALFDSLLTMLGIWAVYFSIKMAQTQRLDLALINGGVIGLAIITKSTGIFYLYLLPVSLVLFNFKEKDRNLRLLKWFGFTLVTVFLSQIIYNSLRLSPLFYIIERKNMAFIRSFSQVIANPFLFFYSNINSIVSWVITYIGLPLFLIFIAVLIYGAVKKKLKIFYLLILILAPFFAEVFFNKVLYPRFVLFYFPYIIILLSFGIISIFDNFLKYRKYLILLVILFVLIPSINSFKLLTNPKEAKIADSDAGQYLNDWPAGYGVSEIVNILKVESQNQDIYVGTEGTFGLLPYALQIYFYDHHNVHIFGFWPVDTENLPAQIINIAKNQKTYFVFNENQKEITNPDLKFIEKYQKGKGNSYMRLYQLVLP